MLNEFLKFFSIEETFESSEVLGDFCKLFSGQSFGDGLFNTFISDKRSYWNSVVEKCFPAYKDVSVIGYDWLGRIFAISNGQDCVKLFDIGAGEVLNIGCKVEKFLNEEIPSYPDDALARKFFLEWRKSNPEAIPYGSCVGYKVPLFLGGKDTVSNLEISDMDVYWSVIGPMLKK